MSARGRKLTVVASAMLIVGFAVAAWAYITAFGSGWGDAMTGTLASPAPVSASPSGTGAAVSWSSVASPSGNDAEVSYTVSRSTDASTWVAAGGTCAGTLSSTTTSCTDSPASSGDYYYSVSAAFRSWTSQAQTSGTVHVTVCVTATKLAFTSSTQTLAAGSVSGVITIQRQIASGTPGTCGSATIDLTSSSGAGSFRDAGNTSTITSVAIPAGSSDATFRYADTVAGSPSVTATDHAAVLTQASQVETVTAGIAAVIRVETAANGSGTLVPAQNVTAGNTLTVYSISRDTYGNFVANVATDAAGWSLANKTGGVANGDLVAAGDLKSAVFTGHLVGTAAIHAAKSGLVSSDSGTITVVAGAATQLRVETAADGSGTVVPAQNVTASSSITVFSIGRDAQGNFIANVPTDPSGWSLTNKTGGVANGDLVAAVDLKSATFTGHLVGSAKIHAVKTGLGAADSGTITVVPGTATQIRVETAADGSGTVVPAQNVGAGSSITVYAISRDVQGNFVANVATDASGGWSLTNISGSVVAGDLVAAPDLKSATFTGHLLGSAKIHAVKTGLGTADSGTITVVAGAGTKYVFITGAQTLTAGNASAQLSSTITVQLQDAGGNATNATSNTTVSLSSTAGAGVFRDNGDGSTITSVTMNNGTNSVSFKYRSTLAGSQTLTAHTAGITDATQAEFVNSAPVTLSFSPSGTVNFAKNGSQNFTMLVPNDAFGNAFTRNTGLVVSLAVTNGTHFTLSTATLTIITGPANNTFSVSNNGGQTATLSATVGNSFTAPTNVSLTTS